MKINTRKLLLLLYKEDETQQYHITYDHLFYLWSDLTAGGARSLIHHLQQGKLLHAVREGKTASFRLTQVGRQFISFHYHLTTEEDHKEDRGVFLILLEAPVSDPQFRLLLPKVRQQGRIVKKGIYFLPTPSPELLFLCKEKYYNSVILTSIKEWIIGDPHLLGQTDLILQDLTNSLSGISTQISRLIEIKNSFSLLNHQEKMVLFSDFDRLILIFDQLALPSQYSFPLLTSGKQVLSTFQQYIFN